MRCFSSILILLSSLYIVLSCPNDCNRHGVCNRKDECECYAPFAGYDCSLRTCPSGLSWDGNHTVYVECSNRGICDREEGICKCLYGYVGKSCERIHCLAINKRTTCDDHGKCISMRSYHKKYIDLDKVSSTSFTLSQVQLSYTDWDADRIFGCMCDPGFKGPTCTIRECPYGVVAGRDKWDSTSFIKLGTDKPFSDLELLIINCKDEDQVYCRYEIFKLISYMTRNDIRDMIKQNGVVRDVKIYFYKNGNDDSGDDKTKNRVSDLNKDDILVIRFIVDPYARVLGYRKKSDPDAIFTLIKEGKKESDIEIEFVTPTPTPTPTPSSPLEKVPYLKFSVCDSSTSCYVQAHSDKIYMECSGLGECDNNNGVCKCIEAAKPSNSNQGYIGDNYEYNYDYTKAINDYNKENFVYNCRLNGKKGYNNIKSEISKTLCKDGTKNEIKPENGNDNDFTQYPYCDCNENTEGYNCGKCICEESTSSIFSIKHNPEMCGGLGECKNNVCNCIPGYGGSTFDPPAVNFDNNNNGNCNLHGEAVDNNNEWEKDKSIITYCKCNAGYDGPTCADKLCSYGPQTTDSTTKYPSIEFTCSSTSITNANIEYIRKMSVSSYELSHFTTALIGAGVKKPFMFYKNGVIIDSTTNLCDSSNPPTKIKIEFPYYCGTELNGGPSTYNGNPAGGYELKISGDDIKNAEGNAQPITASGGSKCYECSNHGICNKATGECVCDSRYSNYKYKEGDTLLSVKNNCQILKKY